MVGTSVKPVKDRIVVALLALFISGFRIHKFYLNDMNMGVIYLIFSWTGIPEIIGFIEGIIYLTSSNGEFHESFVK